jgi:hypothetical protein
MKIVEAGVLGVLKLERIVLEMDKPPKTKILSLLSGGCAFHILELTRSLRLNFASLSKVSPAKSTR